MESTNSVERPLVHVQINEERGADQVGGVNGT